MVSLACVDCILHKSQNSDKNTLLGKFSTRNIETINDSQRMHGLNVQWIIKHVSRFIDLGRNLSPQYHSATFTSSLIRRGDVACTACFNI
jgi:hypothetical protein